MVSMNGGSVLSAGPPLGFLTSAKRPIGGYLLPPGVRQYLLVPDNGLTESRSAWVIPPGTSVGRRVLVSGMAGAGKSTFSRALSARTGLPVIVLDVHFWKPGWAEPTEDEWREKQWGLLASDDWIADGNYHATLDLRLERADTVVFLDTPWWICAWRALVRGIRTRPVGFRAARRAVMSPLCAGCAMNGRLVWRIWRVRRSERERDSESCRGTRTMSRCMGLIRFDGQVGCVDYAA